jgi:hypothetical protein
MKVFCFLLVSIAAMGQTLPPIVIPTPLIAFPALKEYLSLTNEQLNSIRDLHAAYTTYLAGKTQRALVVQLELNEERRRTPLDPMGLGLRVLELEAICRESTGRRQELEKNLRALLTPAQQTRFQVLLEAVRLEPVIAEARRAGLIEGSSSSPFASTLSSSLVSRGGPLGYPSLFGIDQGPLPGCQTALDFPLSVIFPLPQPPANQ